MNKQAIIDEIKNSAYVYNSERQVGYQRIASTLSEDGRFILSFMMRHVLEDYERDDGSIVLSLVNGGFDGISSEVRTEISRLSTIVNLHITSKYDRTCNNMVFDVVIESDPQGVMRSAMDAAMRVYRELDGVSVSDISIKDGRVLCPEALMAYTRPRERNIEGLEELDEHHLQLIHSQVTLRSELLKALSDSSQSVEGFILDPTFYEDIKRGVVTVHQRSRRFNVMFLCKGDMDQFLEKHSNQYNVLSMEEMKPYGVVDCNGDVHSNLSSEPTIFTRFTELTFSCPPRSHMDTAIATAAVGSDLFIMF